MCDIATFFTALSSVVGLKKASDAREAREDAADDRKRKARTDKREADADRREERTESFAQRRSTKKAAAGFTPTASGLFGSRSFFRG